MYGFKKIIFQIIISFFVSLLPLIIMIILRKFDSKSIFFWQSTFVCLTSFIILSFFFFFSNSAKKNNITFLSILPGVLLAFIFLSLVPTIIERSVSISILSILNKNNENGVNVEQMSELFVKKYIIEENEIKVRIIEQNNIKNVVKCKSNANKYCITEQGRKSLILFNYIGNLFNISQKYTM